jgi:outer membrane protein OmpA-like peptidoglycan-associated protein
MEIFWISGGKPEDDRKSGRLKAMKKILVLSSLIIFGLALIQGCATVKEPKVIVLEKLIVLEDTHFKNDTDTLTKMGARAIMRNINILYDNPGVKIRIAGYASCSGTDEYNQKLSERRANTVREILIAGNIAPERIRAIGYGETKSAMYESNCNNTGSKAAKANRRVLFEIVVDGAK